MLFKYLIINILNKVKEIIFFNFLQNLIRFGLFQCPQNCMLSFLLEKHSA